MADFTVTTSPVNTKTWLSQQNLYVKGYSRVRVQCTPAPGSSFSTYETSFWGNVYIGADVTSGVYPAGRADSTVGFYVTATGSSGTVHKYVSVSFLGYAKPSLTTFTAERGTYTNGTWTSNPEGAHIRVEAIPSVSLVGQGNTGTATIKIGNTNPSATSGNYYYFTGTSANVSYTVTGTATDLLQESTTRTITVASAEVPFNIDVDHPGAAFGKVSETSRVVEVAPNWAINANGKYNTFAYQPYSFRTTGGANTLGWARIARLTVTGAFEQNAGSPKIVFKVQSRTLTYAFLQTGFNGIQSVNTTVEPSSNNWLCSPARADSVPFMQTISFDNPNQIAVYDIYFPKGYAEDELTVYTECTAQLQDRITITYEDNLLTTKPANDFRDFTIAPLQRVPVAGAVGLGWNGVNAINVYAPDTHTLTLAPDWKIVNYGKYNTFYTMPDTFESRGGVNDAGYVRIATVTYTSPYQEMPIEFQIKRRDDKATIHLYMHVETGYDTTDPTGIGLYYENDQGAYRPFEAFTYKVTTSVWDVYVKKNYAGDWVNVRAIIPSFIADRTDIAYTEGFLSSIPSGATMAVPVPVATSTATFTRTSGTGSVNAHSFYRSGNVCSLYVKFTLSQALNGGDNVWVGTVSGIPLPIYTATACDYSGKDVYVFTLSASGTLLCHLSGSDTVSSTSSPYTTITYLSNQ